MIKYILLYSLLGIIMAGRAPYLGGDMQSYIEMSKKPSLLPRSNRPVTPKQLEEYKHFQSKFSDIAKAYSEGYKAAIQAVQARAVIARQRLNNVRSKIPTAIEPEKKYMETTRTNIAFRNPVPNAMTVTGIERSGIPNVDYFQKEHNMVQRSINEQQEQHDGFHRGVPSTMLTEAQRNEISRMNAAALHKTHYLDTVGFDSYGGHGVILPKQEWTLKKHKRRSIDNGIPPLIKRQRRSRMPYLGQNLDKIGVVRVVPNWDDPPAKKKDTVPQSSNSPSSSNQQNIAPPQPSVAFISKPVSIDSSSKPVIRNSIPQPFSQQQQQAQLYNNNNNNLNKMMNILQQRNTIFNPYTQYQQASQYPVAYPMQSFQYLNSGAMTENNSINKEAVLMRTRKNASPEPDVAALNYAARHRNVYLDTISGDPYSGGSTVLSRQYLVKTH